MSETARQAHNRLIDKALAHRSSGELVEAMLLRDMFIRGWLTESQYINTVYKFVGE